MAIELIMAQVEITSLCRNGNDSTLQDLQDKHFCTLFAHAVFCPNDNKAILRYTIKKCSGKIWGWLANITTNTWCMGSYYMEATSWPICHIYELQRVSILLPYTIVSPFHQDCHILHSVVDILFWCCWYNWLTFFPLYLLDCAKTPVFMIYKILNSVDILEPRQNGHHFFVDEVFNGFFWIKIVLFLFKLLFKQSCLSLPMHKCVTWPH